MISGQATATDEAVIPLLIRNHGGQTWKLDAVIDTGFTGFLTLPSAEIAALQLLFQQRQTYTLADNTQVRIEP
jgi:predicted aspartyl protease